MNKTNSMKTTLADSVEEQLRKAIITGEIQQGERINIKDLTVKYGVSETPLRTALNRLVAENLIDNYPRQGMVVKPINIERARETFELRCMMELYYADKMTRAYAIDLSLRRALLSTKTKICLIHPSIDKLYVNICVIFRNVQIDNFSAK